MIRNLCDLANRRTIVSATSPRRFADSFTEIILKVWFEELSGPIDVIATPFDCERHPKELWIRAMAGEYGEIEVLPERLEGRVPLLIVDQNDVAHLSLCDPYVGNRLAPPEILPLLAAPRKLLTYRGCDEQP